MIPLTHVLLEEIRQQREVLRREGRTFYDVFAERGLELKKRGEEWKKQRKKRRRNDEKTR